MTYQYKINNRFEFDIFNGYGDALDIVGDMECWCKDNDIKYWVDFDSIKQDDSPLEDALFIFSFEKKSDAVAFKLRWL